MSTTGVITATGTKGLLQYLKTYQPALYSAANPQLLAYAKQQNAAANAQRAANKGMGRMARLAEIYRGTPYGNRQKDSVAGFAGYYSSYTSYTSPTSSINTDALTDINVGPIDTGLADPSLTNIDVGEIQPIPAADLTVTPSSTATDSASVASSGATSSGFASIISSIAKGIGTGVLTAAQVANNNTLLQTNLARAQQGLPPLTATTSASGLTTLGSSSNLLLLGGALLIGLVAMNSNSK
jgi:hypothetical protein